jgi:WG containing repeat
MVELTVAHVSFLRRSSASKRREFRPVLQMRSSRGAVSLFLPSTPPPLDPEGAAEGHSSRGRTPGPRVLFRAAIAALIVIPGICAQERKIAPDQPLVIVKDGRYGYIDHLGGSVVKPSFYWGSEFSGGFATIYVCGHLASIDRGGNIQPPGRALTGEVVPMRKGSKVGYIDSSWQFRIQPIYDDALPFSEGLAAVEIGTKWGFIDSGGRLVIEPRFEAAYYFSEGVAVAQSAGRQVLIGRDGKIVADGFDSLNNVSEGRVGASRGEHYGFIDLQGRIVVPLVFESANDGFHGGLTSVSKAGKWGYIDRNGEVKIPFRFDEAGPFYGVGLAPARIGKQTGFIDRSGNFRIPLSYSHSPGFINGDVAPFWTEDGSFGYVRESGGIIWGPIAGSPEHPPLLGWSDRDKAASCKGIPESVRTMVARFPTGN